MTTKIMKVMAQDDPIYVPSEHSESGRVAKCVIRLKQLEDTFQHIFLLKLVYSFSVCSF